MKVTEEQIELLVKALRNADAGSSHNVARLVGEGESIGFYHGLITGLVMSHQLVLAFGRDGKERHAQITQLISLAAARASQYYLDMKQTDDSAFPEWLDAD